MTWWWIHASTTMSITTSNIICVIGCHSSCDNCHRHGLLLVVLLLPMVDCCNWRFFLLPCRLFLFPSPVRQLLALLTPLPMLLPLPSPSPPTATCIVLCYSALKFYQGSLHSWSCYRCHHHHHRISYCDTCGKGMVSNRPASSSKRAKSS